MSQFNEGNSVRDFALETIGVRAVQKIAGEDLDRRLDHGYFLFTLITDHCWNLATLAKHVGGRISHFNDATTDVAFGNAKPMRASVHKTNIRGITHRRQYVVPVFGR